MNSNYLPKLIRQCDGHGFLTRVFLLVVIAAAYVSAADIGWPFELQLPQSAESQDSSGVSLHFTQTLNRNVFKSDDSLAYEQNDSVHYVKQSVLYQLTRDDWFKSQTQFVDLSGTARRNGVIFPWMTAGIEWTPVANYTFDSSGGVIQGSLDAGPVFAFHPFAIPLQIKGGIAGRTWNQHVPSNFIQTSVDSFSSDKGVFGALEIGSFDQAVADYPLWLSLKTYGRQTERSNLAWGRAAVVSGLALSSGDSILLFAADTITTGNDAALIFDGGKSRYVNTPENTTHSLLAQGAFKGRSRWYLQPVLGYAFSLASSVYPPALGNLLDEVNTGHLAEFRLVTDSSINVQYGGSIAAGWEQKDALFLSQLTQTLTTYNAESLKVNLNDCDQFAISTDHRLGLFSPESIGIAYRFSLSRRSKTYPRFYLSYGDTMRSYEDNDWIAQSHRLDLVPLRFKELSITMYGSYRQNITSFPRSQRSASNTVDKLYQLGGIGTFFLWNRLSGSGSVEAEVKVTDFPFPYVHWYDGFIDNDFPPYSRRLTGALNARIEVFAACSLKGQWNGIYWDQGVWIDKRYLDDRLFPVDSQATIPDYYAIDRKWLSNSFELSAQFEVDGIGAIELGSQFQDVYYRAWDAKTRHYEVNALGSGYLMVPFVQGQLLIADKIRLLLKVKRFIDTEADDYWDCALAGTFLL